MKTYANTVYNDYKIFSFYYSKDNLIFNFIINKQIIDQRLIGITCEIDLSWNTVKELHRITKIDVDEKHEYIIEQILLRKVGNIMSKCGYYVNIRTHHKQNTKLFDISHRVANYLSYNVPHFYNPYDYESI